MTKIKSILSVVVIAAALSSCSTVNKIYKKPTIKEINKAMKYSSWEYILPKHPPLYSTN
jgi:PBP1b-binding outer membrane lipoprotein LpoB